MRDLNRRLIAKNRSRGPRLRVPAAEGRRRETEAAREGGAGTRACRANAGRASAACAAVAARQSASITARNAGSCARRAMQRARTGPMLLPGHRDQ